jgi:hypothetical protein
VRERVSGTCELRLSTLCFEDALRDVSLVFGYTEDSGLQQHQRQVENVCRAIDIPLETAHTLDLGG